MQKTKKTESKKYLNIIKYLITALLFMFNTEAKSIDLQESKEVKEYFKEYNKLNRFEADFEQIMEGKVKTGKIIVSKPKIRMEYNNKSIELISDGITMYYKNKEDGVKSYIPYNLTTLKYLLGKRIELEDKKVNIVGIKDENSEERRLDIIYSENEVQKSIILYFNKETKQISGWKIEEGNKFESTIKIKEIKLEPKITSRTFKVPR